MNQEKEIVYIPKYKKFWYSATKFERYPEMATEGVKKALSYLTWLIFMFSIILAIALLIKFHTFAKKGIEYIDNNFSEINYQNGELSVATTNDSIITNIGNLVINTNELTEEQIQKYQNRVSVNNLEIIWLKENVIIKYGGERRTINYNEVLSGFKINEFNKSTIVNYLSDQLKNPKIYVLYGIILILYLFVSYFLAALINILVLSVFGILATLFAKIQIRYRAIFNMSVYSITISTVLQIIYMLINLFTDFNVKYFDLMYFIISFICLVAAIFMVKSDVIKQQLELMKIIELKRQEIQNNEEEKEEKKEEETKKEESKKEKKEEKGKEESEKEGKVDSNVEGQGSNA